MAWGHSGESVRRRQTRAGSARPSEEMNHFSQTGHDYGNDTDDSGRPCLHCARPPEGIRRTICGRNSPVTDLVARTPFADTRASDLRFSAGKALRRGRRALPTALAECPGPSAGGASCTLRILGASHQVVLDLGDCRWVETLSCGTDGEPVNFPNGSVQLIGDWAYACRMELDLAPDAAAMAAVSAGLDELQHTVRLGVRFAGDPHARTVIGASVRRDGATEVLTWETWHLYPQHGEIVHTVSTAQVLTNWEGAACPTH
ncbi:hypothetical protein CGZ97_15275 [Enemella evansiae]|nr:hypothetical protein CGZ97_15275 [Enemella evansiae]